MSGVLVDADYEIEELEEVWFTDAEGNPVLIDQARDVRLENGLFSVPVKDSTMRVVHGKPEAVLKLCDEYGLQVRTQSAVFRITRDKTFDTP